MNILAIETSCDETSVAVVTDGVHVRSCEIASSMSLHTQSGGIIPENAARKQVEYMLPVLVSALQKAFPDERATPQELLTHHIDAIAVTVGPGLIGSLLVGVETAKTLALTFNKPLIPVNHVKAHVYGAFLQEDSPTFPLLALIVSGGHTDFVYMERHGYYKIIGGTRDDAAGECFDKCARLIGLPYPGGPSIAKAAEEFIKKNPEKKLNLLPRPLLYDDTFDVSFSGLKTAVMRLQQKNETEHLYSQGQMAAEIQQAIVDTLIGKLSQIVGQNKMQKNSLIIKSIVVCGGVSANTRLKNGFKALCLNEQGFPKIHVPLHQYTTDNAAMIGSYAFFNKKIISLSDVRANPEMYFD